MGSVSALATVFAALGWLVVAFVGILIVGGGLISAQMFRSSAAAAGVLAPYLLLSLGPFLAWGILRGLCEIHGRIGSMEQSLQALHGRIASTAPAPTSSAPGHAAAGAGVLPNPVPGSLSPGRGEAQPGGAARDAREEPDQRTWRCPDCQHGNPIQVDRCQRCQEPRHPWVRGS